MTGALRRVWGAPLWAHVVVLAVVLAASSLLARPWTAPFTPDEGLYGLQVRALDDGRWAHDYVFADVDPAGEWFPYPNSSGEGARWYTYVKHPAYPRLLHAAGLLLGTGAGLYVVTASSVVALAALTWLLAARLHPRAGRPGFWLVAVSPAAVNGFVLWAHAPSAAVGAATLLAGVALVTGGRAAPLVASVAAGSSAGVLLRSEGLLFSGAVAIGLFVVLVRAGRRRLAILAAAPVAGAAVVAFLLERAWVRGITGGAAAAEGVRARGASGGVASFLDDRVRGAWHSLLSGAGDVGTEALVLVPVALLASAAGLAVSRGSPAARATLLVSAAAAIVLYGLRFLDEPRTPASGLLAAWPVVLLGVAGLRGWRPGPGGTFLALSGALFGAAVLATQYRIGGGLEWGGRFFSPLLAAAAALAAVGLGRLYRLAVRGEHRSVAAAGFVLAAVPVVAGLTVLGSARDFNGGIVDGIAARAEGVVVTHADNLPRFAWESEPAVRWLLVDEADIRDGVRALHAAGVSTVTLVGDLGDGWSAAAAPYPDVADVTTPALRDVGWQMQILGR